MDTDAMCANTVVVPTVSRWEASKTQRQSTETYKGVYSQNQDSPAVFYVCDTNA